MAEQSRRSMLRATAAGAVGLGVGLGASPATANSSDVSTATSFGPVTVGPSDPRYQYLVRRGHKRHVGSPDYVRVVGSTRQVVAAAQEAVRAGKRVLPRSGGHCLEDFVDSPDVRVIIDLSGMTEVYYDPHLDAFAVEGGATLGEVYERLLLGWGVTIPAGWCPKVGVGGHVAGGGYGILSRQHGLAADHLYAVEVVVVDAAGTARVVVATREPDDPNRDLWWAHTGGGGGSFGIVTRYWFRSPGATGRDPGTLLPAPPESVLDFTYEWSWEGMDEQLLARMVRNHGEWCELNSAAGSPYARFYGELVLTRRQLGVHRLIGQAHGPDAERMLDEHVAAISAGVSEPVTANREWKPWLAAALTGPDATKLYRLKIKSGYLRRRFTDQQSAAVYHHLTRDDIDTLGGSIGFSTYGGQINATPADATATVQRDAVVKLLYTAAWIDPAQDEEQLNWIREFYRDVYAATGGVPDPLDGTYINYPDNDMADPAVNTSGVPWHTLYFGDNYARLRRAKTRWDPRNVFHHTLSVRPA